MNQSGLSFIEMIIATLMVAILSSLGMTTFEMFRERTYMSQAQSYYLQIGTALAAGRIEYDMGSTDPVEEVRFYSGGTTPPLETNVTKESLLPGFKHDPLMTLTVYTDPQCIIGAIASPCIIDQVVVHHCKTTSQVSIANWSDETTLEVFSVVPKSC